MIVKCHFKYYQYERKVHELKKVKIYVRFKCSDHFAVHLFVFPFETKKSH